MDAVTPSRMVDPSVLLPLQSGIEIAGGIVLFVLALAVVFKMIRLAYSVAVKVVVIAIAAAIVLYALSLVGFNPVGIPTAIAF